MSPISDIDAFRNGRWQLEHFLKAIRLAMDWVIEHRAVFDFLSPLRHRRDGSELPRMDLICDLVDQAKGAAEIVTLDVIARERAGTLPPTSVRVERCANESRHLSRLHRGLHGYVCGGIRPTTPATNDRCERT